MDAMMESEASALRTKYAISGGDLENTVVVTRAGLGIKEASAPATPASAGPMPIDNRFVTELSRQLDAVPKLLSSAGASIAPWTVKKNKKAAKVAAAEIQRISTDIKAALSGTLLFTCRVVGQTADAQAAAVEVRAENTQLAASLAQETAQGVAKAEKIESLTKKLADSKAAAASMEEKLQSLVQCVEGVVGVRTYAQSKEEVVSVLALKLQQLLEEHAALLGVHEEVRKSNEVLSKKSAQLADKLRDSTDVAGREARQLAAQVKKLSATKEAEVMAAKNETASMMGSKSKEGRALQQRCESLKMAAEGARQAQQLAEANAEKAAVQLARAEEEMAALSKRLADAKASKGGVEAELEQLRSEHAMLRSEVPPTEATTLQGFMNKIGPFPRTAFTTRNGGCLHSRACGAVDINKLVAFSYGSHKELQAKMGEEGGMFLCHDCRAEPGF